MFTVSETLEVLFEVSIDNAQRVVEPFAREVVFHAIEYKVPAGVVVEPMRVLAASVAPKLPS
jgi:predicted metal-dependent TIM-barrel fold hydrolase